MKNKITKIEKLGLARRVEELRIDLETGGERGPTEIARLLKDEGHQGAGAGAVKNYLKKLDKARRPHVEAAIREAVEPHAIESIEILEDMILILLKKLKATGNGADKIQGASVAARTINEILKTRLGVMGLKLSDPTGKTDAELIAEYEALRSNLEAQGTQAGDRSARSHEPGGRLPN